MTSTNNNNGDAESVPNSGYFDKNEFYEENGMIRTQKKDRKSHSKNAANQMEKRQKKMIEQISLCGCDGRCVQRVPIVLPLTYDGLLQCHQNEPATRPGKSPKNTHVTKLFHNRSHLGQSAKQELLCQDYDEELLAEDEETLLKNDTDNYDAEMSGTYGIDRTMTLSEYDESVALWENYGLTKDQHDANLAYENNCIKLSTYYNELDYANYPEYGINLEADIKKYESDFDAKTLKDIENDDDDNWSMAQNEEEDVEEEYYKYALDDEPLCIYKKWREAQYEREIEDMIQESMVASVSRMIAKKEAAKTSNNTVSRWAHDCTKRCVHCSHQGHTIENCYKLYCEEQNAQQILNDTLCEQCKEHGHVKAMCPNTPDSPTTMGRKYNLYIHDEDFQGATEYIQDELNKKCALMTPEEYKEYLERQDEYY
jgi:hypothetical protein